MGEVVPFPCRPERNKPEHDGVAEAEIAHYRRLLRDGYDQDTALEIVAMSRHIRSG